MKWIVDYQEDLFLPNSHFSLTMFSSHTAIKGYSIYKGYPGGDLKVICNVGVGGIKSIKMWEEGVAQGVCKCNIEFKMCW